YHASLGRYDYPDQFPVFSSHLPEAPVARTVGTPSLPRLQISIKDDLLSFYLRELLPRLCAPGNDADTYGETVYVDADLLQLIHERINVGRYVAQAKLDSSPAILGWAHDADRLVKELKVPEREEALIRAVRAVAGRYELDPDLAETVFRWIIDQTLRVEIVYLQQLGSSDRPARAGLT
ncbi:MAG TPA: chorismate mutase, partial [Dehalococcoidia bacterium]|nr:chorismate mutase [Dehalococcoidia bacterium]